MPVLLMEKDPFVESLETATNKLAAGQMHIRRPLEGVLPKESTHATISVYRTEGEGLNHVSLINSSAPAAGPSDKSGYADSTANFVLQSVQHAISEKAQVVETFGSFHVFFYGQKPQFLQCSGLLVNTRDFNWKNEWIRNYNRYLSGTKCVENRTRVYLGFDDVLVHGYLINTAISYDANNPSICPFNFGFLITGYQDLSEGNDSYVKNQGEGRFNGYWTLGPDENGVNTWTFTPDLESSPEHLGEIDKKHVYTEIDPLTGNLVSDSHSSEGSVDSGDGARTASWVGDGRSMKLWRDPSDALTEIDVQLAVQQSEGGDATTARRALRSNPSNYPLASRSDSSSTLNSALSTGVANAAAVIDDSPAVS